jgi:hypothetical protein
MLRMAREQQTAWWRWPASILGLISAQGFPFASIVAGIFAGWHFKIWPPIFWFAVAWAFIWSVSYYFWKLRPVAAIWREQGLNSPIAAALVAKWMASFATSMLCAAVTRVAL